MITDEEFIALMDKAKEWFAPKIVNKGTREEPKIIDLHKKNLFIGQFLLENKLNYNKVMDIFKTRPWLKEHYDEMAEYQEYKIAVMGLTKELDSAMAKFTLSNKSSWSEKTENKNSVEVKNIDLSELVGFKKKK